MTDRSRRRHDLNRQFYTLQSQLTGPVFNRVWDTPDNGYAEKFKHSIEPYVTVTAHVVRSTMPTSS